MSQPGNFTRRCTLLTARLLRHARDDKELILNRIAEMWRQYADGNDEMAYQIFRELRQKWKNEQKGRRLVCEFEKKAQEAEDLSQKWDRICDWYKHRVDAFIEERCTGAFGAYPFKVCVLKDSYGKFLNERPLSNVSTAHQFGAPSAVNNPPPHPTEVFLAAVKEVEYPYKKQIEDLVEAGFVKLL